MGHKPVLFTRKGGKANPIVLLRDNPAAAVPIRVRNLSDSLIHVGVKYTDDIDKWDLPLPVFSSITIVEDDNDNVDFIEYGEGTGVEINATVAPGVYTDPFALAAAVKAAMFAAGGTEDVDCRWMPDLAKFRIMSEQSIDLLWLSGANGSDNLDTSIGPDLGYDEDSDKTGEQGYLSDYTIGDVANWTLTSFYVQPGATVNETLPSTGRVVLLSANGAFEIILADLPGVTEGVRSQPFTYVEPPI